MSNNDVKNMKNNNTFEICGRKTGDSYPPLVIAEIGINHGGSLDTAIAMVDAAASAGAEVIKHQTHVVHDEMSTAAKKVIPGNASESIFDIMDQCALSENDEIELKHYIEEKGLIFLSTPFSRAAADRLEKMHVCAYKIGSGECNNYPLIEHIAKFGKPIILSTGMNDIPSIKKAVDILDRNRVPHALMHCTNIYPTPPELVRLGAMQEMMTAFPELVIGLSDHTTSNLACFAATGLGANILERHFTDSMSRPGPDIINSMDPGALTELITGSMEIAKMRGGEKTALAEEQSTIDFAFATVVSIKNIMKDEIINRDNIWVKRPGTGEIKAEDFDSLIGKKATRSIMEGEHLSWSDCTD